MIFYVKLQMRLLNNELWLFPNRLGDTYSLVPVYIHCILTPTFHYEVTIMIMVQSEIVSIKSIDKCGIKWSDDIKRFMNGETHNWDMKKRMTLNHGTHNTKLF